MVILITTRGTHASESKGRRRICGLLKGVRGECSARRRIRIRSGCGRIVGGHLQSPTTKGREREYQ